MSKATLLPVEVVYATSDSSTSNPSSSTTMRRQGVKLSVFVAVTLALVYATWQLYIPRYRRDRSYTAGRTSANHKTNNFIVEDRILDGDIILINHLENETEDEEDSAYPFHEEDELDVDVDLKVVSSRPRIQTYFSSMDVSFSDVPIGEDNSIATIPFLDACISTTELFINMQKMILNKVVDDVRGNVKIIRENYNALPAESATLQEMTLRDVAEGRAHEGGTTALALTWLKRAFEFLSRFLYYIDAGEDQTECARQAYEETLTNYHGFATRAVFRAAFMTLSTRVAFLRDLAVNQVDIDDPLFEETAMEDLRGYNIELTRRLHILREFFDQNGLKN